MYGDTDGNNMDCATFFDGNKMYQIETGQEPTTYYDENDQQTYTWNENIEAPIGLMYVHDYDLSLPIDKMNESMKENYDADGWIYIINNDNKSSYDESSYEWLMTRYSFDGSYSSVWFVFDDGEFSNLDVDGEIEVRPTFYLSSDIELTGEGSLTNPFKVKGIG